MTSEHTLDVFIDPSPHRRLAAEEPPDLIAFAFLVAGQSDRYNEMAVANNLPAYGEPGKSEQRSGLGAVIAALGQMIAGDRAALSTLQRIQHDDADDGAQAIAAILESVLLSDGGRPDLAVERIRNRLANTVNPVEQNLLLCQLGLRTLEAGEFGASEVMSAPQPTALDEQPEVLRCLYIVQAHNRSQHQWLSGSPGQGRVPARSESRVLSHIDGTAADGANRYLSEAFNAFFESPYARTFSLVSADQVDRALSTAILRSEFVGDFGALQRLRGLLGRYLLMSEAGNAARVGGTGFSLLRRAQDAKEIGKAARVYLDSGPLEAIREATSRSIATPWFPLEVRGHLVLLAEGVDTLPDTDVDATVSRLVEDFDELTSNVRGTGWITDDALRALAASTRSASTEVQARVARLTIHALARDPDPLLHQALPKVVHSIDWDAIEESTISAALNAIGAYLDPPTHRTFAAIALCRELSSREPDRVGQLVLTAFERGHSALVGSLIPQLSLDADQETLDALAEQYSTALMANLTDASQGKYSMGVLNLGATAADLAVKTQNINLFNATFAYLHESRVSPSERRAIAHVFARNADLVPEAMHARLVAPLAAVSLPFPMFGSQADIDVASIELGQAFGSSADHLDTAVLRLASSDDSTARLDLARLVSSDLSVVSPIVAKMVLLTLAADREPTVRAHAAFGLARTLSSSDSTASITEERLWSLASEPGAAAPEGVWVGLSEAARSGAAIPERFFARAAEVARGHISRRVRLAAAQLVHADRSRGESDG